MKKILLLFAICTVCSCVDTPHVKEEVFVGDKGVCTIRETKVKGHIYLIYDGFGKGNIIHAEHCPCRK